MTCPDIPLGAQAETTITVTREMTVALFHADMPAVFGTPVMIYHMEVTASDALRPHLPEGWVSVGVLVEMARFMKRVGAKGRHGRSSAGTERGRS